MKVRILSYNFLGSSSEAMCLGASQPRFEGIRYLSSYLGAFQIEFYRTSHVCWAIVSTGMERKDVHTLQACPLEILHMRLRNNCPLGILEILICSAFPSRKLTAFCSMHACFAHRSHSQGHQSNLQWAGKSCFGIWVSYNPLLWLYAIV